jgi:hypothetical protein
MCAYARVQSNQANGGGSNEDQDDAELRGVKLRKVFAGIEIVQLLDIGAGQEGGAEFVQAGFQVGDIITNIDHAALEVDRISCAQVSMWGETRIRMGALRWLVRGSIVSRQAAPLARKACATQAMRGVGCVH